MRPPILTDDVLAEIDAQGELDAIEREPTDAPGYGRPAVEQLLLNLPSGAEKTQRTWDAWVRLP